MKIEDVKRQWEFSFDLSQESLRRVYRRTPTSAYAEIRKYLFDNGFDNRDDKQGSCYFTSKELLYSEADKVIRQMYHELPWLAECVTNDALTEKNEKQYTYRSYRDSLKQAINHKEELKEYQQKLDRLINARLEKQRDLSPRL